MKFLFGVVVGIFLVAAGVYWYVGSGRMPVATSAPGLPMERTLVKRALKAALKQAPTAVPIKADEAAFLAGAEVYRNHCAICHGVPGGRKSAIAKGQFPLPPQLFEPDKMVTDDSPGETYWKTQNGIRLTGMPGFGNSLSELQMWQVSLLLANADKISPAARQALTATPALFTQSK